MSGSAFVLRPMMPDDGDALVRLALASPDTGMMQIAPRYHVDAYQAVVGLDPDTLGVVATLPETGEVIGSGFVSFEQICYEGALHDCAWLHGLEVHPDYRRQGIATRLAEWRVQQAREQVGQGGVIAANIQEGNEGSFAVARSWMRYEAVELVNGAVAMRGKPPRPRPGITVRRAQAGEYAAIAQGLNTFYADYNFYAPQTSDSLAEWLARTPFEEPIRHYYVALDDGGTILAGMGIAEEHRVVELEVQHLPWSLRVLNRIVKCVPPDGRMRQLSALKAWFAPGHLEAARYLWETLRWKWRDRGGTIGFGFDARGPLKEVFRMPVWMPLTRFMVVISGPEHSANRGRGLIYAG